MRVLEDNRCLESLIMTVLLEKWFKLKCAEVAPCVNKSVLCTSNFSLGNRLV